MSRKSIMPLMISALILVAAVATTPPSIAGGPPSFSFEAPSGSGDRAASGPVLVVHAYSCHQPTDAPVSAYAEGVIDGKRRTIPLKLESAGATGVYNVSRQWPSEGSWALVFSVDRGDRTTAMVKLNDRGAPLFETVSSGSGSVVANSIRTIPGKATEKDIDMVLTAKLTK